MRAVLLSSLLTITAIALTACSSTKLDFSKAGISEAQLKRDTARCRRRARRARSPKGTPAKPNGSNAMYRQSAQYDCMRRKGYDAEGGFIPVAYALPKPKATKNPAVISPYSAKAKNKNASATTIFPTKPTNGTPGRNANIRWSPPKQQQ